MTRYLHHTVLPLMMYAMTSCEGVFGGLYDEASDVVPETKVEAETVTGTLYVEANAWNKWYYIDLPTVVSRVKDNAEYNPNEEWQEYDIPMPTDDATTEYTTGHQKTGQYTYWFDTTIGQSIKGYEFRNFTPTEEQTAPDNWTFAVHRSEVRTNGCSVWESTLDDIDNATLSVCKDKTFTPDEWSETDVWDDQSKMLLQLIPCQGIRINKVLGRWLTMGIMPNYVMNNNVFFVRLADGSTAALQLTNHLSATNTRCCLTIKFRYPLK